MSREIKAGGRMVVGLPAGTPLSVDLCMPDKACNGRNVRCTMLPLVVTLTVPMLWVIT